MTECLGLQCPGRKSSEGKMESIPNTGEIEMFLSLTFCLVHRGERLGILASVVIFYCFNKVNLLFTSLFYGGHNYITYSDHVEAQQPFL